MKIATLAVILAMFACSDESSGPAECVAAGGRCLIGGNPCANRGLQNCNPYRNPGGAFCCLPCANGTKANDAGTACE